ncbi:hypothetical protein UA08_02938 [Talaromyces atroroseus]|uniref:Xylanolytic transcriptional activator regulatory domain-containing protein n=1 Tax=Talaromyces atroroseus TaxID=1441469 RepID=A0A225AXI1_TALAT|nr:hypothetical protein UA08_02938 [Talaromyces atroroseus]OKL62038.1 hypothetical protein UA08_02938 [Talaromyces atroroseus]
MYRRPKETRHVTLFPKRVIHIPSIRTQVAHKDNLHQYSSDRRWPNPDDGNDVVKPAALPSTENRISSHQNQISPPWDSQTSEPKDRDDVLEEERNALELADAALGQPQRVGRVPFYTGHDLGPTSALNICVPDKSLSRHLLIPPGTSTILSDEDREYLQKKGVYKIPENEVCNSLLRAYFTHVHPIIPVIEPDVILNHHTAGRLREFNLLLLWCIFFVGANFISPEIYELEGYGSRKEMKAAMYSRAICLYNNGGERDQIVLLQASLLMGFWHSEVDEHTQPWYWIGVAVSLCQMLGLHRDPDSSKYNSSITDRQRRLWRRLWWTCFSRDRWLSLTLGRPLRIDLKDCDMPMPTPDDLLSDIQGIPQYSSASYLPSNLARLSTYWITYIELSRLLGTVLIMNYQTQRPTPMLQQGLDLNSQENWNYRMSLRADAAASRTNVIIESIVQDGLLDFAGPMTPPLLVPAMQMHLLRCKAAGSLPKRLQLNKLYTCLMVLSELQKTYTVASIYRGVFARAIHQIFPEFATSTILARSLGDFTSSTGTADLSTEAVPMPAEAELDTEAADDLINMLFNDEASIFNFLDMNQVTENFSYYGSA